MAWYMQCLANLLLKVAEAIHEDALLLLGPFGRDLRLFDSIETAKQKKDVSQIRHPAKRNYPIDINTVDIKYLLIMVVFTA